MPVNGRSGYKDKMEQKKTHKQPKIPRNSGQTQLYVMHIEDENKVSNILKLCWNEGEMTHPGWLAKYGEIGMGEQNCILLLVLSIYSFSNLQKRSLMCMTISKHIAKNGLCCKSVESKFPS